MRFTIIETRLYKDVSGALALAAYKDTLPLDKEFHIEDLEARADALQKVHELLIKEREILEDVAKYHNTSLKPPKQW